MCGIHFCGMIRMLRRENKQKEKKRFGSFASKNAGLRPGVAPPPPPSTKPPKSPAKSPLSKSTFFTSATEEERLPSKHERKRKTSQSKELKRSSSSKFYVPLTQSSVASDMSEAAVGEPQDNNNTKMAASSSPVVDRRKGETDAKRAQFSPNVRKTAMFFENMDAEAAASQRKLQGKSYVAGSIATFESMETNSSISEVSSEEKNNPVAPHRRKHGKVKKRVETMDCQTGSEGLLRKFTLQTIDSAASSCSSTDSLNAITSQSSNLSSPSVATDDATKKSAAVDFLKKELTVQMVNKDTGAEPANKTTNIAIHPVNEKSSSDEKAAGEVSSTASPPKPQILRPKPKIDIRQTRVNIQSFTTEDFDICQRHIRSDSPDSSQDESPPKDRVSRKDCLKPSADLKKINAKRRSRSLGAGPNLEFMAMFNKIAKPPLPERPPPKKTLPNIPAKVQDDGEKPKRILPKFLPTSSSNRSKESLNGLPKPRVLPAKPKLNLSPKEAHRRSQSKSPARSSKEYGDLPQRSESHESGLNALDDETVVVESSLYGAELALRDASEIELHVENLKVAPADSKEDNHVPSEEERTNSMESKPKLHVQLPDENSNPYEDIEIKSGSESNRAGEQTENHFPTTPVKMPRMKSKLKKDRLRKSFRHRVYEDVESKAEIPEGAEEEEELDFSISGDDDSFSSDSFTDESDEFNSGQTPVYENPESPEQQTQLGQAPEIAVEPTDKLHQIANEVLSTERGYVKRLHLIDQVFHNRVLLENRQQKFLQDDLIPQIFINVKSIYQFHDFLLNELDKRMKEWEFVHKIGDIMMRWAPFLKLYTEYINKFDNAMNVFSSCLRTNPTFGRIVDEVQAMPECGNLTLQHHMLDPIQRLPRYELLLKDYLKHLEEDAEDRQDTQKALELVTKAAAHANETIRKNERSAKLLSLSERLIGASNLDLISPTRDLVKEGHITKISARDGSKLDRYLFLFSDVLLVCVETFGKNQYKIKTKLDVEGMRVMEGDDLFIANTFLVKSKTKSIEFHASDIEDKDAWQTALWGVISEYTKKKMSRMAGPSLLENFQEDELGKRAPTWIKDQAASMCMLCAREFTTFFRRHHCRACGQVICGNCSTRKTRLKYDNNKYHRVCDNCYNTLELKAAPGSEAHNMLKKTKGLKAVKASDASLICGYLQVSQGKKHWDRRYFAVRDDFVLYSFKAHQDLCATTSLPLPGYVSAIVKDDHGPPKSIFKLFHIGLKKEYYFQAQDKKTMESWHAVLEKVVRAELPDEPVLLTTNHSPDTVSLTESTANDGQTKELDLEKQDQSEDRTDGGDTDEKLDDSKLSS